MTKDIHKYFEELSNQTSLVNRLVVTLYVEGNNVKVENNIFLKSLIIQRIETKLFDKYKEVQKLLSCEKPLSLNDLIFIYEKSVPFEDRIINGVVYTPEFIKEFIVENAIQEANLDFNHLVGADIACGSGGFLITLAKEIKLNTNKNYSEIFRDNLYGLDITDYSIERTKILLSLLAVTEGEDNEEYDFNLFVGNALEFDWFGNIPKLKERGGFDLIVGNPPYVTKRNMDDQTINLLAKWPVTEIGNTDLYIPFFELGHKYLSEKGCLGYITVNTFFRSLNARLLRKLFQRNKTYLKILDFGDEPLFGSRSTYSCICFLKKEKADSILSAKVSSQQLISNYNLKFEPIPYCDLNWERGWLLTNGQVSVNLKKIESAGTPLGKKFMIKGGFATLKNDLYVFQPCSEDERFYYREFNGEEIAIEKDICKLALNPNRIKKEDEIIVKAEQIIFPYKRVGNNAELIKEKDFIINFPKAYEFLHNNREALFERDKGKGRDYGMWYQFGRNQSLADKGIRLLYPHICKEPHFFITETQDLLFYNGNAIYANSKKELLVLKKILESDIFKYFLKYSSRNYSGSYISLSKNYIKYFGICDLNDEEMNYLLSLTCQKEINSFLWKKYGIVKINKVKMIA